jgi:hypothetical protein
VLVICALIGDGQVPKGSTLFSTARRFEPNDARPGTKDSALGTRLDAKRHERGTNGHSDALFIAS